jgi:hypothetical protein
MDMVSPGIRSGLTTSQIWIKWTGQQSMRGIWRDTIDDMDRQRRKQAEFLIYRQCDWHLIEVIGVLNERMQREVNRILRAFPAEMTRPVQIHPEWYY